MESLLCGLGWETWAALGICHALCATALVSAPVCMGATWKITERVGRGVADLPSERRASPGSPPSHQRGARAHRLAQGVLCLRAQFGFLSHSSAMEMLILIHRLWENWTLFLGTWTWVAFSEVLDTGLTWLPLKIGIALSLMLEATELGQYIKLQKTQFLLVGLF